MMTEMSWEVDKEVNRDENGEADVKNLELIQNLEDICMFVSSRLMFFSYDVQCVR